MYNYTQELGTKISKTQIKFRHNFSAVYIISWIVISRIIVPWVMVTRIVVIWIGVVWKINISTSLKTHFSDRVQVVYQQ